MPFRDRLTVCWCSTPRGITGKIAFCISARCHQSISSCSTPRGITGKIALWQRSDIAQSSAWCSTPRGITGKIAMSHGRARISLNPRAQRLAASQEKSPVAAARTLARFACAQRLAASQEKSPLMLRQADAADLDSAQRLAASQEKSLVEEGSAHKIATVCSTPRGITGKIASSTAFDKYYASCVLNASRHHRKNRCS